MAVVINGHSRCSVHEDDDVDSGHRAHYRKIDNTRLTADEMDEKRKENIAYEYLCHLEEAKVWMEACINEQLAPTVELEESLRNGVALAKLAHFISPELVPLRKVYDTDLSRYNSRGLHFRHTDNVNHWLRALEDIGLPRIFYPETTDIYDRKNMPRVIYCIHALSLYLFKLGKAPQIQDLYGKINFTAEEISNMRRELEKYGIQMPAFSKIGGILANEMPVDEAALHAAIIVINDCIDRQVPIATVNSLKNPVAHLVNIVDDLMDSYQDVLFEAKTAKAQAAHNKSLDPNSSYVPDVYDELLTQAEIQGYLNQINLLFALSAVNDALDHEDANALLCALKLPFCRLRDINDSNAEQYMTQLIAARQTKPENNNMLSKDDIQLAVNAANLIADEDFQRRNAVGTLNQAIDGNDALITLNAVKNPLFGFPSLQENVKSLYHEELRLMKAEKGEPLDYDEISGALHVLSALSKINQVVEMGNSAATFAALSHEDAHIRNLDESCRDKYHKCLWKAKASKQKENPDCDMLRHSDIQRCIDEINGQVMDEHGRIVAVNNINEAIDRKDPSQTLTALQVPSAGLRNVIPKEAVHYQQLLYRVKAEKIQETSDPTAVLWYEEIQCTIDLANTHAEEGHNLSVCVGAINILIDNEDSHNLLNCLLDPRAQLRGVTSQCTDAYLQKLLEAKRNKSSSGSTGSGWLMNRVRGVKFYFNVNSMEHTWHKTDHIKKDNLLLTHSEIQSCITEVTAAFDRQSLFKTNEPFIVQLQARIRGFLARKRFRNRQLFVRTRLPAIVKIQSWWKMVQQRRRYVDQLHFFSNHEDAAIVIQSHVRAYLARRAYLQRLQYYRNHIDAVVRIQAFMRSAWAKQDYRALMHAKNPPIRVVCKFLHLLDVGDNDYAEELEMEKLRQLAVVEIRSNQQLEADLNQMDIKIGLLVKNRITIQDVVSQNKKLKNYGEAPTQVQRGLKALSKANRERLEAYQHLFYLLQTNPAYLAHLIFAMPQSKTTKFMESAILTLYNYASNQREEYLLLKLFKTALEEEISKLTTMSDIITGNPMVVKMVVSFNRNGRGQGALRDLLNPLVRSIVEDRNLQINTHPTEVYKQWINQMEAETGKASGLPYEVTIEQALEHQPVRDRIESSIQNLQDATERFLSSILQSIDKIPYGMRLMAKVTRNALRTQFPTAPEKDILKIIGNLIYYRYINSAIVAPDAFDIIDVGVAKGLTNEQRRNLGSVAKILQFAASNKGFGTDSPHLVCMNKYIMDAHVRFKRFFAMVCDVEEPEIVFNVDQYTDVTRITKPIIYISIGEIIEMHKLLLEYQATVAPDPRDPLHELLDDLGEVLDVDVLIGDSNIEDSAALKMQLAKTEISLTLMNKFEVPDSDDCDKTNLLLRTKQMIIDVIRCQKRGDNLMQILNWPETKDEENIHQALMKMRERVDNRAANKNVKLTRNHSSVKDLRLSLGAMKTKVISNLRQLEQFGVANKADGYQAIVNSIVQDIRNQRLYRQRRRQDMQRLRSTLKSLSAKRAFYEEQINYYNQYVKTCLDNLAAKRKSTKKAVPKIVVKYSAARLHEKGVVLEIEGLPHNQFKNVLFEISSTDTPGQFDVNAKFMGVTMETVDLVFQDLLELQYEGIAVMKMFDRAQVNVNLLIFLLNKKFFGKK